MRLYIYNIMFNKLAALNKVSRDLNFEIKILESDNLHQSIEYITGKTKNVKPGKDVDCTIKELLLFDGFSDKDLDEFLALYKKTGAPAIAYKATITPINLKWSPSYLYKHLQAEIGG